MTDMAAMNVKKIAQSGIGLSYPRQVKIVLKNLEKHYIHKKTYPLHILRTFPRPWI